MGERRAAASEFVPLWIPRKTPRCLALQIPMSRRSGVSIPSSWRAARQRSHQEAGTARKRRCRRHTFIASCSSRSMNRRVRLPGSHSHGEGDESEEHARHLQPHHARKSHKLAQPASLRPSPRCFHRLQYPKASWPGEYRVSGAAPARTRLFCRFSTGRPRRLHQRLYARCRASDPNARLNFTRSSITSLRKFSCRKTNCGRLTSKLL